MRRVAVRIVQIEVGENNTHSFAIVAVEAVSTDFVRRVAGRRAVVRRRYRAGLVLTGADQIRTAI